MDAESARRPRDTLISWCGCLLLALYVAPLYFPPGPVEMTRLAPDAGLLTRLFPDVPGWWIVVRLSALVSGSTLIAWAAHGGRAIRSLRPEPADTNRWPPAGRYEWMALAWAALLVGAATRASSFPRWGQYAFIAAPLVPILVLATADRREGVRPRPFAAVAPGWWMAVSVLVAGWLLWRVVLAAHDPRAADFVDMWLNFAYFRDAASSPSNLLTQPAEPGVSNVYMLALGTPLLGPVGFEPSFVWLQRVHGLWIGATAVGVALLARRFAGPAAMLPAVAMFLFSPFTMSMAVSGVAFGFATALAAILLLLVCRIYESYARAELVALAALVGFCATFPHLTVFALGATLAVLPRLRRGRPSPAVWATAALIGIAMIVPMIPSLAQLPEMRKLYLERRAVVAELEPLIRGQKFFSLPEVDALWHAGVRGVLDVPLGALLQPFAIPRTPVRLGGDVYYEPIGAALAAVGLAACVGMARRRMAARLLLGAMVVGLIPGAASSSFDRASLTRNLAVPVLLGVLTAIGVTVARRALRLHLPSRHVLGGCAAAIALSGIVIFDVVNPRIVATSWLGLTLRALQSTPADEAMLLEHGRPRRWWLHVPEIAYYVPPQPLRTLPYRNAGSLLADPERDLPAASLLLWSPGVEEEESIREKLCGCWPDARLYSLRDRSGLAGGFAARLTGPPWEPALPRGQWSVSRCVDQSQPRITCDTVHGMAHYNEAQTDAETGRIDDAITHYRAALGLMPRDLGVRNELGLTLAARGRPEEAIAEFRELLRLEPTSAAAHNGLAIALEAVGRVDEAITEYREAARLAPTEPRGHLNLAAVLAGRGRMAEAAAEYREALADSPDLPEAHLGLGHVLVRQGRPRDALVEYRAALVARPGWRPALLALAWLLATTEDEGVRDPAEALSLATQAASDGDVDAETLRALAVAYAAAGRFDEAAAAAARGLEIARRAGQDDVARDLGDRVTAYGTGRSSP